MGLRVLVCFQYVNMSCFGDRVPSTRHVTTLFMAVFALIVRALFDVASARWGVEWWHEIVFLLVLSAVFTSYRRTAY